MLNINLNDIEVSYDLSWDKFGEYVNLVVNNCFTDGNYTPHGSREAMYFGFLMYCTNLDIDFQENIEEIKNHAGLLYIYTNAKNENPNFFSEVDKYVDKTVNHILEKSYHSLENTISDFIEIIKTPVISLLNLIEEKVKNVDLKDSMDTLKRLEKSGFNPDNFAKAYLDKVGERNDNEVIKSKNEQIKLFKEALVKHGGSVKEEVYDKLKN